MERSAAEANKALVREIIDECLNKGNFEAATGRFAGDYTIHLPSQTHMPSGPGVFQHMITMWRTAFPDWHMRVEEMVAEGEFVANRFTTTGTHDGMLMGIPPTGKQMVVRGQEMHRVVDGQVAATWVCDDLPSILVQLAVLPRPPIAPPQGEVVS
ncbi:MAG: hypothetical protein QOK43_1811 [Acidimicrobiaceae bacterium]|nr:hypothetical protein [Acidimicrobiaceae bacterium]